jgi:hypothetical protein
VIDYIKSGFWGLVVGGAIVGALAMGGNGCIPVKGAESPERATARSIVLMVAKAVQVSDNLCATYALQTKEVAVAKACADAYDLARPSLLAAETGVDTWDDVAQNKLGCAVNNGVSALVQVSAVLAKEKLALPTIVTDALQLASSVKFTCNTSNDGGVE